MEQSWKTSSLFCLDTVLQETQNSEQTQQVPVPDGMPDIGRVLGAWGQGLLRSKEWRDDRITVNAGMMVWILYLPEDGSEVRCLDTWVPFQVKWDLPEDTPEGQIRICCHTRFVDARNVSPRKIMVRCGMAIQGEAFGAMQREICLPDAAPEGVELLKSTYPIRIGKEAGEKAFLLEEALMLPDQLPTAEKLLYFQLNPQLTDKKVLTDKVVFRGNGNLHLVYQGEEGKLCSWDAPMPFSQFEELDQEHGSDAQTDLVLTPTALELELDDEGRLQLTCGITAQYRVTDKEMLTLVEDAYSPVREVSIQKQDLDLPVILETRRETLWAEQAAPSDAAEVVDVRFLADQPRQSRAETDVELNLPGTFQTLYYGQDGALRSSSVRWEGRQKLNAAPECILHTRLQPQEPQQLGSGAQSMTKVEIPLDMTATTRQRMPMVTGVTMEAQRVLDANRPSLILRKAGTGRLWDIAKNSGSTVKAIRQANQLEGEPSPDQMLLIPVL